MTEIIKFPEDRKKQDKSDLDNMSEGLKERAERLARLMNEFESEGYGGMFIIEHGRQSISATLGITPTALGNAICCILEDEKMFQYVMHLRLDQLNKEINELTENNNE